MGKQIGEVTHYFDKIGVAVIKLSAPLKVGDKIVLEGHGKEFEQVVDSMQVEHESITAAKKGAEVGMKTLQDVKAGDKVFLAG